MAYFEPVSKEDMMTLIKQLSKGNPEYKLNKDEDIKEFASYYFRYSDYDYFDVLDSLVDPYEMTRRFKWFSKINLELEPDDTPELNHRFIKFICTRMVPYYELFCESTIKSMKYFLDDHIDQALMSFINNDSYNYQGVYDGFL